jgi:hypothetical protein
MPDGLNIHTKPAPVLSKSSNDAGAVQRYTNSQKYRGRESKSLSNRLIITGFCFFDGRMTAHILGGFLHGLL